jgi:hypothetical protein
VYCLFFERSLEREREKHVALDDIITVVTFSELLAVSPASALALQFYSIDITNNSCIVLDGIGSVVYCCAVALPFSVIGIMW